MFTGLIEEIGSLNKIENFSDKYVITIKCKKVLDDSKIGDSISLNGMCVTIIEKGENYFKADIMPESIKKSLLSKLKSGTKVNLERALKLSDRIGGHLVSGHIDGVGKILNIMNDKNAMLYNIEVEADLSRFIVDKGSISVDGTSLTVVYSSNNEFQISLIPTTSEMTILKDKSVGDMVNIECDIIGKYIYKFMTTEGKKESNITMEFLSKNGFL